jgi:hypothetical protein
MPVVDEVAVRHPLRELKSGTIGFLEACAQEQLGDERLLDLIGFALIGQLAGKPGRVMSGVYAMDVARRFDVSPYCLPRAVPPPRLEAIAAAIAEY